MPGAAVFLTRAKDQTPPVLVWHVRQNRALHEYVLALTLTVLSVPWSDSDERVRVERVDDKFWRAEARRGFMERPDISAILRQCKAKGAEIDLDDVTFYVGHETVIPREDGKGMPRWQEACSRRWAATQSGSATISNCPAIRWWRSGARSRFEGRPGAWGRVFKSTSLQIELPAKQRSAPAATAPQPRSAVSPVRFANRAASASASGFLMLRDHHCHDGEQRSDRKPPF